MLQTSLVNVQCQINGNEIFTVMDNMSGKLMFTACTIVAAWTE